MGSTRPFERRKRTRHLIELGGLVVKAELVNLIGDDRATMLGALLWIADKLQSDQGERARALSQQRGSKRSRRTRRHTRGQIDPIQQLVVEPRQWYVNDAKTDGCKRVLEWGPTLPLQRRHKCGQRRRVNRACDPHPSLGRELNLDRTAGSGGRRQWLPVRRNGDCSKTDPASCRCTGSDPQPRTPARLSPPDRKQTAVNVMSLGKLGDLVQGARSLHDPT